MALETERPRVTLDPTTILDGEVRCPCERNGRQCNQLLGILKDDSAEFYCRACQTHVVLNKPALSVTSEEGRLTSLNVQNATREDMLVLLLTQEQQAHSFRAQVLDILYKNRGLSISS